MKAQSVRTHLKQALAEVEQASQHAPGPIVAQQLEGIAEILNLSEEPPLSPEAMAVPERGALDTIQRRLGEILDETDDETVVKHLERAKREILLVIVTLDDQWNEQHEQ